MLLYVHRNHKAHSDGEPRTATSTFTQLLDSIESFSVTLVLISKQWAVLAHILGGLLWKYIPSFNFCSFHLDQMGHTMDLATQYKLYVGPWATHSIR